LRGGTHVYRAFRHGDAQSFSPLCIAKVGAAVGGIGASYSGRAAAKPKRPDVTGPQPFPVVEPKAVGVSLKKLKKLVHFIDSERDAGTFPGAGVIALRHGKLFLEHYCGTYRAGKGADQPFHRNVRVMLASVSKALSATVVVMAHQDGLVDYDVPVATYIPEFVGGGKETITLRHLLTHAAGIPNARLGSAATEEEWRDCVRSVCAAQVEWPPGSKTQYHAGSGMFVAAEAVRRVSDMKPWNRICRERLFDPIGADSLSFAPPESADTGFEDAFGPDAFGGHPAGGCAGTLIDVVRVVQLHLNKGVWEGRAIIQPKAFSEMHTVQYAAQIAEDAAMHKFPRHEPWGLGWLLRGVGPRPFAAYWFRFGDNASPGLFGHAGIDTIVGVGDPALDVAYAFAITKSLQDNSKATLLRQEVANRLFATVT
jgi:CubicO group peptidase (beta-lactamase class C family)